MPLRQGPYAILLLLSASMSAAFPVHAGTPHSALGAFEFPTSGSKEVQRHFLRGVGALHSFWYEGALHAFRKSTAMDPNFMMGYWGEAMAHNHPIWREENADAARAALAKIRDIEKLTPRERAYITAAKVLYGEGDKRSRDKAYSEAMEKIYRDHPDDLEAACFYALSLLGRARQSDHRYRLQIHAGSITLEVFRKNADHPGAAHYTIHAFDHPDLAILALPAARRYAAIAPASHHAQHMPAHIFVQLGMWPEAAASNEVGWRDSVAWVEREGLPMGLRDYHSLQWLHYVYLQQGRYKEAEEVLSQKLKDMREADDDSHAMESSLERRVGRYYERMAAASVIETERWQSTASLEDVPGAKPSKSAQALLIFARGFAAALQGRPEADTHLATLRVLQKQPLDKVPFHRAEWLEIWELEITAAARASKGEYDEAIRLMQKARALEEELPPSSGLPRIIKPTHELLGEILLRAGKATEAVLQFSTSLLRHPNRARSLLGAARAAAQSGDQRSAVDFYAKFLEIWKPADPGLPELREAQEHLKQGAAS